MKSLFHLQCFQTVENFVWLKFDRLVRGVLPFMAVQMASVIVFAYVPWFITWLPGLMRG